MERNISLDFLKLTMAFMVVGMHTGFLANFSPLAQYLSANGLFRIAVPVFLVINGYYFYPVIVKNGQREWFKRVFILYLVWMLFYASSWLLIPEFSIKAIINIIIKFLFGYYHLWYISGMFGAAILITALKKYSSKFLAGIIVLTFIAGVAIQYLGNYHVFNGTIFDNLFNYYSVHRNFILFSFPFFCIGFLINKHSLQNKLSMKWASLLTIFGIVLLFVESSFNYYQPGRDGAFDNYATLILVCPMIFVLFNKLNIKGRSKEIALYSTAIYFIHIFIMEIITKVFAIYGTLLTISVFVVSGLVSFLIIKANQKLKVIL